MNTSEKVDQVIPAMLAARKEMAPAAKSARNKFDGYDYATEGDWHKAVMDVLLKHALVLTFSIDRVKNLRPRGTKAGGTEHAVEVQATARLWHASSQWIEVQGAGHGQDRADKAVYKAITGAKKYLYSLLFALPTEDTSEAIEQAAAHHRGNGVRPQRERPVARPAEARQDGAVARQANDGSRLEKIRADLQAAGTVRQVHALAQLAGRLYQGNSSTWPGLREELSARMAEVVRQILQRETDGDILDQLSGFLEQWPFFTDGQRQEVLGLFSRAPVEA